MDFGIEGLHEETGPGVIEAAIAVDKALAAADKAALFKTFAKVLAQRTADGDVHGEVVEGLARPERPHPPVAETRGRQAGVPRRRPAALTMSETMRWFVGGQQQLMPELLAMIAPTINSYRA